MLSVEEIKCTILTDQQNIEVAKFLCLTQTEVQPVSFYLPRAAHLRSFFQDDVYGDALSGTTTLASDEWFEGKTAEPTMVSLKPEGMTPVSEKPKEETRSVPKVIDFREKLEKEKAEKEQQDATFARLHSLAVQHATYHPNLSMGGGAASHEDSSSDSGWDD